MVLRPNSADESCSMSLEYTQPHDRSVAPSLVIEMANPRVLFLFRQAHPQHTYHARSPYLWSKGSANGHYHVGMQ